MPRLGLVPHFCKNIQGRNKCRRWLLLLAINGKTAKSVDFLILRLHNSFDHNLDDRGVKKSNCQNFYWLSKIYPVWKYFACHNKTLPTTGGWIKRFCINQTINEVINSLSDYSNPMQSLSHYLNKNSCFIVVYFCRLPDINREKKVQWPSR